MPALPTGIFNVEVVANGDMLCQWERGCVLIGEHALVRDVNAAATCQRFNGENSDVFDSLIALTTILYGLKIEGDQCVAAKNEKQRKVTSD